MNSLFAITQSIVVSIVFLSLPVNGIAGWVPVEGPYLSQDRFQVEMPKGWRLKTPAEDELVITKDGVWLQFVRIGRLRYEKQTESLGAKLSKGMEPMAAAEAVRDEIQSKPDVAEVKTLEISLAQLADHEGFKLVYSYVTKRGMKRTGVYWGAFVADSLFFLNFEAPTRHYFERDRVVFEQILKSFKITL